MKEDAYGQGGSAVGQVDAPGHLVAQGQNVGEKFEEFGSSLATRRDSTAATLIDRDAVVVVLPASIPAQIAAIMPPCGGVRWASRRTTSLSIPYGAIIRNS
ncbi:hypothetical protein Shyd_71490 [Streptomyces hydrogenans]|uniref:Uncharacterized protein n=1 Tax=Streptomyces hydrogenans TaxID=1873719 RepID=A0ABQ3PL77_9ACTN|nr:hypothetical protein Shyd_71490 [Streptomyces hydrogenans]